MSGLFGFLIFAAFFFFMMRFGCGAHAGHGGHHSRHRETEASVDPVCRRNVADDQGYAKRFQGKVYRFCSRDCLDKFEAEPNRYTSQSQEHSHHPGHEGHHS